MTSSLKIGLALLFLFQLMTAASFELAHDEAYYLVFSRHLDFGFFDHPPFVAALISLFSFLPKHELSVRLGFVLLQFGTLFLLFRMIPRESWWRATLMFFSFPLASFAGLLALPDMPLLFMTALYFSLLPGVLRGERASVLMMGPVIALLLYAKYHGILLVFFTILALPGLLLRKDFWIIALISLVLFFPHLWWQYEHNFITLRYHFLERPSSSFSLKRVLEYLGTQVLLSGVFIGPIVWWKLRKKNSEGFHKVLRFTSWGILVFFLVSSFSKKIEANWTISLVIPQILLLASDEVWSRKWVRALLFSSFAIVLSARIAFFIPELPAKRLSEFHGWSDWAQEIRSGCGSLPILANNYQVASKLSFYLEHEVSAINLHSRKNQFDLWANYPAGSVCYVTDKSGFQGKSADSPDGKTQKIVTGLTTEELLKRKADVLARKKR